MAVATSLLLYSLPPRGRTVRKRWLSLSASVRRSALRSSAIVATLTSKPASPAANYPGRSHRSHRSRWPVAYQFHEGQPHFAASSPATHGGRVADSGDSVESCLAPASTERQLLARKRRRRVSSRALGLPRAAAHLQQRQPPWRRLAAR